MTRETGTLHEEQTFVMISRSVLLRMRNVSEQTFVMISRSVLLRMRNVSDESCRENRNKLFVFVFGLPPPKVMPLVR
jgi:hypothetical protein